MSGWLWIVIIMEEDEYNSTYNELASVRCAFEKALTNNHAKCYLSKHFCLADREGYSCEDAESSFICAKLLETLRGKSVFVFRLKNIDGPLPHNMEIRVQVGGVMGLLRSLDSQAESQHTMPEVDNINGVINKVIDKFGSLNNLPYSKIIQSVEQFQGRQRRQR
ncbi:MAG: hypothetical protein GQ573_08070 [Gammaproteobacteria bacterium]|nr:hypothetical protein [Gammaproteobacteria bacterium]